MKKSTMLPQAKTPPRIDSCTSQKKTNNKNALEQKLKDGKTAVPPWLERNAPTLPPPPAQSVGEGASRSRRTQPAYLGERLEAGDWRLAIFASLQSLISGLQFRQQLRCGFGACLLVELTLFSTRWMSGAARTLHRRCYSLFYCRRYCTMRCGDMSMSRRYGLGLMRSPPPGCQGVRALHADSRYTAAVAPRWFDTRSDGAD